MCILHIHDILSACVVWFTFVYRKQEHLAVGSSRRGLTDSRGSFPLWDCLSLTCCTKYIILREFCQEVFQENLQLFSGITRTVSVPPLAPWVSAQSRMFSPLDIFIVPQLVGFVKRELFFLRTFFTRCTSSPILVSLVGTSLLTFLLYHNLWGLSRGFGNFFKSLSFRSLAIFEVAFTLTSPLDMIIIPHYSLYVNTFYCVNFLTICPGNTLYQSKVRAQG